MARSLLSVQIKKAISDLEKEYENYIRCANETQKKIKIMMQAYEIMKPQNRRKGLDGRVIERKKREPKFQQSLDWLLSTVLKQDSDYHSTSEILKSVLELDGKAVSLKNDKRYLQSLYFKLTKLQQQGIVIRDDSQKGNLVYWKLNA